jgi:hypothetical protein
MADEPKKLAPGESNGADAAFAKQATWSPDVGMVDHGSYGLTKRELFAAMFMQAGLVANALVNKTSAPWDAHASDALDGADALLAELEKPK